MNKHEISGIKARKEKGKRIVDLLKTMFPNAKCGLNFKTPFELLIATILSAQSTDKRVNIITPVLFQKFPTPEKMAEADVKEIEEIIRSIGLFRSKAKNIHKLSQILVEKYNGKVPSSFEELTKLPGVGRKTANVVLGELFGNPKGIVVDTHMKRISKRLGLTTQENPEKIEKELNQVIPRQDWVWFSHAIISFGRSTCTAIKPKCDKCPLKKECLYYKAQEQQSTDTKKNKSEKRKRRK